MHYVALHSSINPELLAAPAANLTFSGLMESPFVGQKLKSIIPWQNAPKLSYIIALHTYTFSVVYFSRGTLPTKKSVRGHLAGGPSYYSNGPPQKYGKGSTPMNNSPEKHVIGRSSGGTVVASTQLFSDPGEKKETLFVAWTTFSGAATKKKKRKKKKGATEQLRKQG